MRFGLRNWSRGELGMDGEEVLLDGCGMRKGVECPPTADDESCCC